MAEVPNNPERDSERPKPEPRPVREKQAAAWRSLHTPAPADSRDDLPAVEVDPAPAPAMSARAREVSIDIESLVGGKWFAVVGALIFVVGIGLLVRLAMAEGWFGGLAPAAKCGVGAALGLGVLVLAEALRRRVNAWALVGLNAAGLGALFASAYAIFGVYQVVDAPVAAALLGLCTAAGVVIAARTRLSAVAVVTLLGGYLSPVLLSGDQTNPMITPLYLGMLLATGLVLAAWMGGSFVIARALAWWFTLGLGAWWVWNHGADGIEYGGMPMVSAAFVAAVWAAVHAELIWSSLGLDAGRLSPPVVSERLQGWDTWRPVASSLSTTIWAVGLGMTVIQELGAGRWTVPALAAGLAGVTGFAMASGVRVLRETPRTIGQRLGAGLTAQSGALLLASVALALSGWAESVVWLAAGVAAAAAAMWIRSIPMMVYAAVVMLICTGRLLLADVSDQDLIGHRVEWMGLVLSRWTILAVVNGLAWTCLGGVLEWAGRRGRGLVGPVVPGFAMAVGLMITLGAFVNLKAQGASIALVWSTLAAVFLVWDRVKPGYGVIWAAAAVWFAALVLVLGSSPTAIRRDLDGQWLVMGTTVASLVVGSLGLVVAGGVRAQFPKHPWIELLTAGSVVAFVVLTFFPMSFESHRAAARIFADPTACRATLSVWWAFYATAAIAVGFAMGFKPARLAGLSLLGIVAVKVLVVDLMGVSLLWRAISFLAVGLAMLAVAVVYGWISRKIDESKQHPTPMPA